jgi:hypothetical protein
MPHCRVALLTVLACLVIAAPAAASERSEARQYAAAMQPKLELTPEEAEAVVADYEARSAHISATCLVSVKAAAKKDERALTLAVVYAIHAFGATYGHLVAWSEETDARLAAIETGSRVLRRARAARTRITEFLGGLHEAASLDFCAMVEAWRANHWEGRPPGSKALFDEFKRADDVSSGRRMQRGTRLLRHHGATRGQLRAFNGQARWPELREPAEDVVFAALGFGPPERTSPDEGGRREPSALVSHAHTR